MSTHQGAFTKPRLSTPLLLGIVLAANGTPDEFYYLGLAQEKQDKLDGARAALEQAIKLDPGHSEAQRQLAELRQRTHGKRH
jgi:Tfp pilus assembly protein PilF